MSNDYRILPHFIVFEGLDGSGKSTQAAILADRLYHDGHAVWLTAEPTEQEIGRHIRAILQGEYRVPPETLAVLYAGDRFEHLYRPQSGIMAHCGEIGEWVVCCRYIFSSLAYQGLTCDETLVANLNRDFPLPAHLIYLDLSPEESRQRRLSRSVDDIFEAQLQFQSRVYERYRQILAHYAALHTGMQIHTVSAAKDAAVLAANIAHRLGIVPK